MNLPGYCASSGSPVLQVVLFFGFLRTLNLVFVFWDPGVLEDRLLVL